MKCPISPLTNIPRTLLHRDRGPEAYTQCYSYTASDITTRITSTTQASNPPNTLSRLLNGECHATTRRTPSGASCLEPRLKLQVSLVQGRLAVSLPSQVRPFGIQHANYTRTVLLPTHATAKYDQPQHPSRSHLGCSTGEGCLVLSCSGHVRASYRRQKADSMGLFSPCLLSTICSCVAVLLQTVVCVLSLGLLASHSFTSQQYSHTLLGNHAHYL